MTLTTLSVIDHGKGIPKNTEIGYLRDFRVIREGQSILEEQG